MPQALEPHLARLAASYRALYGRALPDELAVRAAAAAAGRERGAPADRRDAGGEAELTVTAPRPPAPVTLRPVVLPGGIGPHKCRDRRLLESHEADDPATMPLLLDADGLVLETSRASVVVRAPRRHAAHAAARRPHPARRDRGARPARPSGA